MVAFVWANGRIEFGSRVPSGAFEIARGPASAVRDLIERTAARTSESTKWRNQHVSKAVYWVPDISKAIDADAVFGLTKAYLSELANRKPAPAGVLIGGCVLDGQVVDKGGR